MTNEERKAALEAIIYAADEPATIDQLSAALGEEKLAVQSALDELVAPTSLFAMMYLRYVAEESDSWDETKDHESQATRESELIRDTSSGAFAALAVEKPGKRWTVLQALLDAEDANRLLLARELTIEEKREFVDLAIDAWLRSLPVALSRSLRSEWSVLRELDEADLTLRAIRQLIDNERLRGSQGA